MNADTHQKSSIRTSYRCRVRSTDSRPNRDRAASAAAFRTRFSAAAFAAGAPPPWTLHPVPARTGRLERAKDWVAASPAGRLTLCQGLNVIPAIAGVIVIHAVDAISGGIVTLSLNTGMQRIGALLRGRRAPDDPSEVRVQPAGPSRRCTTAACPPIWSRALKAFPIHRGASATSWTDSSTRLGQVQAGFRGDGDGDGPADEDGGDGTDDRGKDVPDPDCADHGATDHQAPAQFGVLAAGAEPRCRMIFRDHPDEDGRAQWVFLRRGN